MEKKKVIIILVVFLCGSLSIVGCAPTVKVTTDPQASIVNMEKYRDKMEKLRVIYEGRIIELDQEAQKLRYQLEEMRATVKKSHMMMVATEDSYVYPVWYCTDRTPVYKEERLIDFSSKRGHENHYGFCKVFVPKSHVIGSMGSPLWKQFVNVVSGHERDAPLKLQNIESLEQNIYWQQIREFFAEQAGSDQSALIYIHGYNISFEEATLRAAQLGVDLAVPLTAYFSWPSQGGFKDYMADEASVEACEPYLTEFLTGFINESGAKQINLLVHSMGNRVLLRSIKKLTDKIEAQSNIAFGQIFLMAPDIDKDTFLRLSDVYSTISERTTLYASSEDVALKTSGYLHKYVRAGYLPPVTIVDGIDTIDASQIDFSFLGHGYYAGAREVLDDMHNLLINNNPPNMRFAIKKVQASEGIYWRLKE